MGSSVRVRDIWWLGAPPARQSSIDERLGTYLRAFFELRHHDETTFLARLASPRPFEDLPWQSVLREDFSNDTSLLSWKLSGKSWSFEEGSLVGIRTQRRSEARTRVAVPPCRVCDVKLSLSLSRPSGQERGAGRSHSRASIDLWWRQEGTGVTLTLSTRKGRISLHQTENGKRLDSRTIGVPLTEDSTHDLELRSNAYELELWLDGDVVLTTPNRLTTPLSGWVAIRPRRGSIQLNHLELQSTDSLPSWTSTDLDVENVAAGPNCHRVTVPAISKPYFSPTRKAGAFHHAHKATMRRNPLSLARLRECRATLLCTPSHSF